MYPFLIVPRVDEVHERAIGRATTNSIEHDHMAVRRRTRVIRVFPNEASFLRLASALASERNEQWTVRRYVTAQKDRKHPLENIAA